MLHQKLVRFNIMTHLLVLSKYWTTVGSLLFIILNELSWIICQYYWDNSNYLELRLHLSWNLSGTGNQNWLADCKTRHSYRHTSQFQPTLKFECSAWSLDWKAHLLHISINQSNCFHRIVGEPVDVKNLGSRGINGSWYIQIADHCRSRSNNEPISLINDGEGFSRRRWPLVHASDDFLLRPSALRANILSPYSDHIAPPTTILFQCFDSQIIIIIMTRS